MEETAAQTAAINELNALPASRTRSKTVKDLTTYALGYAAVLIAAIAVMGLLASTAGPASADASDPPSVVAQAEATQAAATMNMPF